MLQKFLIVFAVSFNFVELATIEKKPSYINKVK